MSMLTYYITGILIFSGIIVVVLLLPSRGNIKTGNTKKNDFIRLTAHGKTIIFRNPFDNFLVYAGANSGKTKSIGKPLMGEYLRTNFAMFVYDYKDDDLSKTAYHFWKKYNLQYPFYHLSFTDLSRSHRCNPIAPNTINDENVFIQCIGDMFAAYSDIKNRDEWYNGALGALRGIAFNFYHMYPELCTIPHIANFTCTAGAERLIEFIMRSPRARALASAFIDSRSSTKTRDSYLSSLTNALSLITLNKNMAYVLSGNDFDFNLIDPKQPKIFTISNSFQIDSILSPIIALVISLSARRFTLENKIKFCYVMDEATTFKVPDFEKMPSVLREYKAAFIYLTQSGSKVEKLYSKLDRSAIEANFGNQFYGKTTDVEALKSYPLVFGKEDKRKISRTAGSSSGRESQSRTVSSIREERYDSNFFNNLKAGEFVGVAQNSNYRNFHLYFDQYNEVEENLPIVRPVIPLDVDKSFENILNDINSI